MDTYIISNRTGKLVQYLPEDIIQMYIDGKGTGMNLPAIEMELKVDYLIRKDIELNKGQKVVAWVDNSGNIDPVIIPYDWLWETEHVRLILPENDALKKKSGTLADLASDMITRKVEYERYFEVDKYYLRPYLKFLEKDDGFILDKGIIKNTDSKFSNVLIEQFGTFTEDENNIYQVDFT